MLAKARRHVMVAAERLGVDSQVKHLRALADKGARRDLRDHEAFRFLLTATIRSDSHTIDVGAHAVQGSDHYGTTPRMMHEFLAGQGYRIFDFAGDGPYDADRFEAVFDQPIWNFLAVPA